MERIRKRSARDQADAGGKRRRGNQTAGARRRTPTSRAQGYCGERTEATAPAEGSERREKRHPRNSRGHRGRRGRALCGGTISNVLALRGITAMARGGAGELAFFAGGREGYRCSDSGR